MTNTKAAHTAGPRYDIGMSGSRYYVTRDDMFVVKNGVRLYTVLANCSSMDDARAAIAKATGA